MKKPVLGCSDKPLVESYGPLIKHLAKVSKISALPKQGLRLTGTGRDCLLEISEIDLENYKDKLAKKVTEQEKLIKQIEKRLDNKAYVTNAPVELVKESKEQLALAHNVMKKMLEEQKKRF